MFPTYCVESHFFLSDLNLTPTFIFQSQVLVLEEMVDSYTPPPDYFLMFASPAICLSPFFSRLKSSSLFSPLLCICFLGSTDVTPLTKIGTLKTSMKIYTANK